MFPLHQWKRILYTALAAVVGGFLSWVMILGFMQAWPIIINAVRDQFVNG